MNISSSFFTSFVGFVMQIFNTLDSITIGGLFSLLDVSLAFLFISVVFGLVFNMPESAVSRANAYDTKKKIESKKRGK